MVEHLKDSALPRAVADVASDLADLFQKEMKLARTEITEKLSAKLRAGIWMGAAAGLGIIAALLIIQGIVFGIATFGIALHWSCLIVAGVIGLGAAAAFAKAQADGREELIPTRTLHQVKRDIATAKEQLT
jgi:hypothetical protein